MAAATLWAEPGTLSHWPLALRRTRLSSARVATTSFPPPRSLEYATDFTAPRGVAALVQSPQLPLASWLRVQTSPALLTPTTLPLTAPTWAIVRSSDCHAVQLS